MKKTLRWFTLSFLILLNLTEVRSQDKGLMVSFGAATFQMDDMKYLQEQILLGYPVEGKIISAFPLYSSTSINFLKKMLPQITIGAGYAFTSTGGKSDYTDYSGNIYTMMTAQSHRLGALISYTFWNSDRLDLSLYGRLDANFTNLEILSIIYALGLSNTMLNQYRSISPNGSAGLEMVYNFNKISVGMEGGYLVDLPASLNDKELDRQLVDPADGQRVLTTDWTGFRTSLKVIFWF